MTNSAPMHGRGTSREREVARIVGLERISTQALPDPTPTEDRAHSPQSSEVGISVEV